MKGNAYMEREGRILPHHELDEKIERLFHRYWDEEMSEEEQYEIENDAEELVRQHGWSDVYCAAYNYLRAKCTEPEAVINFAHLYWIYGWHKNPIDAPYEFLGCFYARIDMDTETYDEMDILDSLALEILPKSGYREVNLYDHPQYLPETDSLLLEAVRRCKDEKIRSAQGAGSL